MSSTNSEGWELPRGILRDVAKGSAPYRCPVQDCPKEYDKTATYKRYLVYSIDGIFVQGGDKLNTDVETRHIGGHLGAFPCLVCAAYGSQNHLGRKEDVRYHCKTQHGVYGTPEVNVHFRIKDAFELEEIAEVRDNFEVTVLKTESFSGICC